MNQTVRDTVRTLRPRYTGRTDSEIINVIRIGRNSGEALFYLLFDRYQDMLHSLFAQEATAAMEFSDFMLELNMRLFDKGCTAVKKFDEKKASFKTYLSKIAHNLLYDLRKKEKPTLECTEDVIDATFDDGEQVMQLIDAINSYTDSDARYVLFKVIEGYKSREIALMLSSRRHEEGTLDKEETLKPSYIDTIRSRALRKIRKNMMIAAKSHEEMSLLSCIDAAPLSNVVFAMEDYAEPAICVSANAAYTQGNPFLENLRHLLSEII